MKRLTILITLSICSAFFFACEKNGGSTDAGKQVCLDWGKTRSEVADKMGKTHFTEDETTMYFSDYKEFAVVAYQFSSAFLSSTLVLLPGKEEDVESIGNRYLKGYTHLGLFNNTEVYSNEDNNTMAVVYPFVRNNESYVAIGWSMLSNR